MSDNFYKDNDDLRFWIEQAVDWDTLVELVERGAPAEDRPASTRDARDVYEGVLEEMGKFVAKQIAALITGRELGDFNYRDKGSMATIGRHKAVVEVNSLKLGGAIAWYAWLWLHLFYLIGGRNKIGTMADWTWNYLTFDRGNRHIIDIS